MVDLHGNIKPIIVVAGGSGQLGQRIIYWLIQKGAHVKALSRKGSFLKHSNPNFEKDFERVEVDYQDTLTLQKIMEGSACFVSALSGLEEVIEGIQSKLLQAAVAAGVPRFIPSDYCIDYTRLSEGSNRNLDLRRSFSRILEHAGIASTSVFNGMFTELLRGQAPVILHKPGLIFYWGNADQQMDFTTMENTAEFTAAAALDPSSPRYLKCAGQVASMREIQIIAERVYGKNFKLFRPGGLNAFSLVIRATKAFTPASEEVFPAWQGMQYLHNMLSGKPKLDILDNSRYPEIKWKNIEEVLKN